MNNINLKEIMYNQKCVLENLFSYYVYDMSEFLGLSITDNGLFTFDKNSLTAYWHQNDHKPYFIYVENEIAGFVLLRRYPECKSIWDIEQYFVLKKFKGQGVGKRAFQQLTEKYPGQWQVRILKENKVAMKFWLATIESIVKTDYLSELAIDVDLEMHFIRFRI
ncbi:GNAT family N-acetyltransferase [Vibrio sp. Of14-4]|uniref:GNAT family N-acetyltransferase n=1 Tax=Vibrio sp. Of14-4 TaxID=2724878 RepID=UPI001EF2CCA5|nr:GNAT family N-acetyltransferase [Vibrio sp. Of14-4]MCG7488571.1 GNAT family N-acetyltransferase [Vibrio sp. Of14-4]